MSARFDLLLRAACNFDKYASLSKFAAEGDAEISDLSKRINSIQSAEALNKEWDGMRAQIYNLNLAGTITPEQANNLYSLLDGKRTDIQMASGTNQSVPLPAGSSTEPTQSIQPAVKSRSYLGENLHLERNPDGTPANNGVVQAPAKAPNIPAKSKFPSIDKTFQTMLGVDPDGLLGPATRNVLDIFKKSMNNPDATDEIAFAALRNQPEYAQKKKLGYDDNANVFTFSKKDASRTLARLVKKYG